MLQKIEAGHTIKMIRLTLRNLEEIFRKLQEPDVGETLDIVRPIVQNFPWLSVVLQETGMEEVSTTDTVCLITITHFPFMSDPYSRKPAQRRFARYSRTWRLGIGRIWIEFLVRGK